MKSRLALAAASILLLTACGAAGAQTEGGAPPASPPPATLPPTATELPTETAAPSPTPTEIPTATPTPSVTPFPVEALVGEWSCVSGEHTHQYQPPCYRFNKGISISQVESGFKVVFPKGSDWVVSVLPDHCETGGYFDCAVTVLESGAVEVRSVNNNMKQNGDIQAVRTGVFTFALRADGDLDVVWSVTYERLVSNFLAEDEFGTTLLTKKIVD